MRTPVPVSTQTAVPSVTGEGDDMFCLRMSWSPPPSSCFQRTAPVFAIERPQIEAAGLGDVQEDVVLPDDRRRAAAHRQRRLPGDVLGRRPLRRQADVLAGAIELRAAPLRPVVGVYGKPGACRKQQPERNRCSHRSSPPSPATVSYNERILCHCPATRSPGPIASCSTATRRVTTCWCRRCAPTTRRASCGTTWSPRTSITRRTATSPTATSATWSSRRSPMACASGSISPTTPSASTSFAGATSSTSWTSSAAPSGQASTSWTAARTSATSRCTWPMPSVPAARSRRSSRSSPTPSAWNGRSGRTASRTASGSSARRSAPPPARCRWSTLPIRSTAAAHFFRDQALSPRDTRRGRSRWLRWTAWRCRARSASSRPTSKAPSRWRFAGPTRCSGPTARSILSELHPLQLDRVSGVTPGAVHRRDAHARLPLSPARRRRRGRGNRRRPDQRRHLRGVPSCSMTAVNHRVTETRRRTEIYLGNVMTKHEQTNGLCASFVSPCLCG